MSETLQVSAKFAEINLRIYGPQVVTAARTLAAHPGSAAARENLDVFVDMWAWLLSDAARLAHQLLRLTDDPLDKQQYSSLPRPGVRFLSTDRLPLLYSYSFSIIIINYCPHCTDTCLHGYEGWAITAYNPSLGSNADWRV